MEYSKLGHEIEMMQLKHKHEKQVLEMKQEEELKTLKEKCTHEYEDGSSAAVERDSGSFFSFYYCKVCGANIQ